MGDLAVFWNNREGRGEIRTDGADLAQGDPLETAILVSLFTDARAEIDELPPGIRGQRGWWGSTLEPEPDNIGSKLWLLDRSKQTNDVPVRAEEYARAALGWIVTDGLASSIQVEAEWCGDGFLAMSIVVQSASGETEYQYEI